MPQQSSAQVVDLPHNESTTPILHCVDVDESVDFYTRLGFTVTYRQTRPYVYLAVRWRSVELHFGRTPQGLDPDRDEFACLIAVDEVAPYHSAVKSALKEWLGRVPATGHPRLTRFREGASRFTLVDPSGNCLIFVQRGEPVGLEYGGSSALTGLAKALDNARILSEFKNDGRAAFRALESALRRPKPGDNRLEQATARAMMIEIAERAGQSERIPELIAALQDLALTDAEFESITPALAEPDSIRAVLKV